MGAQHCSPAEGPCVSLAGVQSALYGLALSLLICVAAVAVFTTHVLLLLPVLLSILGRWAGASSGQGLTGGLKFFSTLNCLISCVKVSRDAPPPTPRRKEPLRQLFVGPCTPQEEPGGTRWQVSAQGCVAAPSVTSFRPPQPSQALSLPISPVPRAEGSAVDFLAFTRDPLNLPSPLPGLYGWGQVQATSPPPAGIVCLVVTIMYWSGWEMGAVEAISLSILVGSSVDYCVHLVEGYLLAGESLPPHQAEVSPPPAPPIPKGSSPSPVPLTKAPKGSWTPWYPIPIQHVLQEPLFPGPFSTRGLEFSGSCT